MLAQLKRVKVQDLSTQRSHATEQSLVDVSESFQIRNVAHMRSMENKTFPQVKWLD